MHMGYDRLKNPVDVIEYLASGHKWTFDRSDDDEISIFVGGQWGVYTLSCTWLADVESLHLACTFNLQVPKRRRYELLKLIGLINAQLWMGHFGFWDSESVMMYRHALLLTGGLDPAQEQCETALVTAITSCERYYQAFHFVLWAGKTAEEALECALLETIGEA